MAEKKLNTRLRLKYDTLDNWSSADPVLLKGEVGIVYTETTTDSITYQPAILFKVGDGTKKFSELPWASGLAADVHSWAKQEKGNAADIIVSTAEGNTFKGKNVAEAIESLNDQIGALTDSESGLSIADMITAEIQKLDVTDSAVAGQYVSAVSEEDGKITVTRANLPDFSNKVDKEEGKSLISDTEIERLASIKNYDDSKIQEAISTLTGNSSVEGSVDKKIADAFNDFATKVSDDKIVNTYKELIDYAASHGSDFTELVGEVDKNTSAIATLNGDANTVGSVDKKIADAANNYATADQGKKANTAIQEVTTTADNGLKVTKTDTSVKIDIDDETVFVLYGGSASGFTE